MTPPCGVPFRLPFPPARASLAPLVFLDDRGLEPVPDEGEDASVGDPLADHGHELGLGDGVEVFRQVRIDDLGLPWKPTVGDGLHRLMGRALRAKPRRVVAKVRLEDRLHYELERHLHDPIPDRGDSQRALAAIRLGYPDPTHPVRAVRLAFQLLLQLCQVGVSSDSSLDVLKGHAIHARRAPIGTNKAIGMTENVRPTDLVVQGIETKRRLLLGLGVELPLQRPDRVRSY